jgi:hypothetical protein
MMESAEAREGGRPGGQIGGRCREAERLLLQPDSLLELAEGFLGGGEIGAGARLQTRGVEALGDRELEPVVLEGRVQVVHEEVDGPEAARGLRLRGLVAQSTGQGQLVTETADRLLVVAHGCVNPPYERQNRSGLSIMPSRS